MPQGNMFSSSSRSQMGSNAITGQSQGGGSKKAGFPYQVGRSWQTSIALGSTDPVRGRCCTLTSMQTMKFTAASQSRPIGSRYSANYGYWSIPGTGH